MSGGDDGRKMGDLLSEKEVAATTPATTMSGCSTPASTIRTSSAPSTPTPGSSTPSAATMSRSSTPTATISSNCSGNLTPATPTTTTTTAGHNDLRALAEEVASTTWRSEGCGDKAGWINSWARTLEHAASISPTALARAVESMRNPETFELFECSECGKLYTVMEALAAHALEKHGLVAVDEDDQPWQPEQSSSSTPTHQA